ncbi:DUF362 domain-containing protein [Candidatus Woesearchaeota archaeon]|nr:DUF362 domain-containing protein [Candidatus Woesearchaeota archaeon]
MEFAKELTPTFLRTLKKTLAEEFKDAQTIAIKIHFGEVGNSNALKPKDVQPFTELLSEMGKEFFLYDTSVAYPGPRSNPLTHKALALAKGWGKLGKISLGDDIIKEKGAYMTYEVAKKLADADGVLVISHVKGHTCTGFGGAIKNLGMGALSKQSKRAIHNGGKPKQEGTCTACKACEKACPAHSIRVLDKPKVGLCYGCSDCGYVCPTGYMAPKTEFFDKTLADGALAAEKHFKTKYYINIIKGISKLCDCVPTSGKKLAKDAGYLHDGNMAAIDRKSHEILFKQEGKDVFKEANLKSGLVHIEACEQLQNA